MKRLLIRKRVWLPLLFLVALVVSARYMALRVLVNPEELKAVVEQMLSEQFAGRAHVDQVRIGLFSGVELKGISVTKPGPKGLSPFIQMESLGLKNYLTRLLQGQFVIQEVHIERPVVFITRDASGRWNVEQPTGGGGGGGLAAPGPSELASISVHDAVIVLHDAYGGKRLPNTRITGVNFTALSREPGSLPFTITGRIADSILGPCLVSGSLDLESGLFNLTVSRRGLLLDSRLAATLRSLSQQVFGRLSDWRGTADLRFNLSYDLIASGVKYKVMAKLLGNSVAIKDLPYPLVGVFGSVTLSDEKLTFQNVRGRWGTTRFVVDGSLPMSDPAGRSALSISVINLPLEGKLAALAGKDVTAVWKELNPAGQLDILCKVRGCPTSLTPLRYQASIFLKECGLSNAKRGVSLQHINGQIDLTADRLTVKALSGRWRDVQLQVPQGALQLTPDLPMDFVLCINDLPLSKEVRAILPSEKQATWDLFNPKGVVTVQVHVRSRPGGGIPVPTVALVCRKDCSLTYKPFPRRVTNLQGTLEFGDKGVAFRGLTGEVGAGKIAFADTVIPYDRASPFNFEFEAKGVACDRELYEALGPVMKAVYDQLKARGRFDIEWHQQRRKGKNGRMVYDVVVRPQGAGVTYGDVAYPLSNLKGEVLYDGSKVVLNDLVGSNRGARITVEGQIPQSPESGTLNIKVTGRNVPLDDDLKEALPEQYRGIWEKIAPKGTVHFGLQLNDGIDELGERLLRFSVPELRLVNCEMNPRVPVTGISGAVKLTGEIRRNPRASWASGEVNLAEATVEGKTYDSVDATFHNEWDTLTFPYIEAKCYGGKVVGEFKVNKGASPEESGYEAFFRAENVSAGQICKSAGLNLKNLDGAIFADLRADATSWKKEDLNAEGSFRITQGHLGDLSALLGVKDQLGAKASDQPAFTDADFEYLITENEAVIKKARLLGPKINLKGEGKITLDGELALEFHPEPGGQGPEIPVLSDFVDGMFGAVVTVSVTGTVWNPVLKVDPLIPISKLMQGLSDAFGSSKKKPMARKE